MSGYISRLLFQRGHFERPVVLHIISILSVKFEKSHPNAISQNRSYEVSK